MNQPLVSIIVPIYNVEHFLADCLDSLINQTYKTIEIIAVNDGSKDKSLSLLESYADKDNRIHIISQQNSGVSAARNAGIQAAKGKYICFVDGDDWMDVHTCEKAVNYAEYGNYDVVLWNYVKEYRNDSSCVYHITEERDFNEQTIYLLRQKIVGPIEEQMAQPQYIDSLSTVWGKLYKSALIKNHKVTFVSTQELGTGEDLLFNIDCFQYVKRAQLLKDCFSHYRKYNTTSLTSVYKADFFTKWQHLQERIWQIVRTDALLTKAFYNRVAFTVIGLGLNEGYSKKPFLQQKKQLQSYLQTPNYVAAYKQLDLHYFPMHWRLFFSCAKYGYYIPLLLLLKVIQYKINENN